MGNDQDNTFQDSDEKPSAPFLPHRVTIDVREKSYESGARLLSLVIHGPYQSEGQAHSYDFEPDDLVSFAKYILQKLENPNEK